MTELYSLIAATAAERLGLAPRFAHLDSTSFHLDGRSNSDEVPDAQVIHITRGYSRDQRPDLNQVMLELMVASQAGISVLMKPLRGHSSDAKDFGEVVRPHIDQLQTSYGTTYLVAASALYRADNLPQLAKTRMKWITRVPGPWSAAQEVCTHANPARRTPLEAGDRFPAETSTYGGVAQRWMWIYSEHRRQQAQRTVDKQWCTQRDKESHAFKKLCRRPLACEADAQQALADFGHG